MQRVKHSIPMIFCLTMAIGVYIFLFLRRFVYPDSSFDVINYHIYLGKSAFENFPLFFSDGEFFPLGMHQFNPMIDLLWYAIYKIFGYRLGTLGSLLSLIGVAAIIGNMMRKMLPSRLDWQLAFLLVLFAPAIFFVNNALFEIATYFTDIGYLFILTLQLGLLVNCVESKEEDLIKYVIIFSFLTGVALSKLTNLIYEIPFFFVFFNSLKNKYNSKFFLHRKFVNNFIVYSFITIIVCYSYLIVYNYTGNPVFPYYNGIFKSIYFPIDSWHFNFGPRSIIDRIFYPFLSFKDTTILGEIENGSYLRDRKLHMLFFFNATFIYIFVRRKIHFSPCEVMMAWMFFQSFILWQFTFGYMRYGMFLEVLGGLLAVLYALKLFRNNFTWKWRAVVLFFGCFLVIQTVSILQFNYLHDFSWRPGVSMSSWLAELGSGKLFEKQIRMDDETKMNFSNVDFLLQCGNPSSGYAALIPVFDGLPLLNFDKGSNRALSENADYVAKRDRRLIQSLSNWNGTSLRFAAVANKEGGPDAGLSRKRCLDAFEKENVKRQKIKVEEEIVLNNFVGDESHKISVFLGTYIPEPR